MDDNTRKPVMFDMTKDITDKTEGQGEKPAPETGKSVDDTWSFGTPDQFGTGNGTEQNKPANPFGTDAAAETKDAANPFGTDAASGTKGAASPFGTDAGSETKNAAEEKTTASPFGTDAASGTKGAASPFGTDSGFETKSTESPYGTGAAFDTKSTGNPYGTSVGFDTKSTESPYGTSAGFDARSTESPYGTGAAFETRSTESTYGTGAGFDARNTGMPDHGTETIHPRATTRKAEHTGISKRAFAIILVLAMLLTMLASVAASMLYMNSQRGGEEATNYTLTTSDETLSYKSIIKKTQDSVVSISTEAVTNDIWAQNYVTQGAGSGVIISDDGYIITCEHVVEGASKITVTLHNKKEYDAKVIGMDVANDLAVIKIKETGLSEATYGDSSKLEVGDQVVAIGNPLGSLSGTATTGIISALNRNLTIENRTLNLFQTDASINPGNSGGGMFDASGNLIGIVEAKSTGSDIDGLGFATPINKAADIAKSIIKKGGDVGSGDSNDTRSGKSSSVIIGIMIAEIDDQTAKGFGYTNGGLLIRSVTSKEAMKAGLEEGDIIYEADGKKVTTQQDLTAALSGKKPGDKLKLKVARENGKTATITTELLSASQSR